MGLCHLLPRDPTVKIDSSNRIASSKEPVGGTLRLERAVTYGNCPDAGEEKLRHEG